MGKSGNPAKTGWQYKAGKLRCFSKSGKLAQGKTVQGIKLGADGWNKSTAASKTKIACIECIKKLTKPGWSRSRKLRACWSYSLTRPFVQSAEPKDVGTAGWVQRCALRGLRTDRFECFGCACTFSMLAYELGYEPTVYGSPKIHAYVIINGKRWDNMASHPKVSNVRHWKVVSWASLDPQGTKNGVVKEPSSASSSKNGIKREQGATYLYQNGKKLKNTWKSYRGKTYYFKKSGKAATGAYKVRRKKGSAKRYWVFSAKGVLLQDKKARTVTVSKKKCRVRKDGRALPGWSSSKTKLYLKTGELACGARFVSGKLCWFSAKGTYSADKTFKLRAAAKPGAPSASLVALLGKPASVVTTNNSCYTLPSDPSLPGVDRTRKYANLIMSTFVASNGVEYLESLVER